MAHQQNELQRGDEREVIEEAQGAIPEAQNYVQAHLRVAGLPATPLIKATAGPETVQSDQEIQMRNRLRQSATVSLHAALSGAEPCVVPFELLSEWTHDFAADRKLGEGSFGTVYEAICCSLLRLAVKRLSPTIRLLGDDSADEEERDGALACLRREVNVLSAFRHPNIIKLLGYTDAKDRAAVLAGTTELCLVYELAPRGGLDTNLTSDDRAADLTWRVRVRIAAGVSRALNYLHCHDPNGPAYHRDVKSANVALMADLSPKLIDCGLAKYIHGRQPAGTIMSASGARFGTPQYQCPAYLRTGSYDARSEVFSFGMVILELLTGKVQTANGCDLYGTFVDDGEDVMKNLDVRAGEWNMPCAMELSGLSQDCLARVRNRMSTMLAVMRRLVSAEDHFCKRTPEEQRLALELERLQEELRELRGQRAEQLRRPQRPCAVCFDTFDAEHGAACPLREEHFTCAACFTAEVATQVAAESRGVFAARGARVTCRACLPNKVEYADSELARVLVDQGFAGYRRAVAEVQASRAFDELERQFQAKVEELRARLAQDEQQERVRQHRIHITEDILSLRCPRCKQVFVDFAGCFALTCSRCNCGFCAYCLEDCGSDAHRHVAGCTLNVAPGRGVYGRFEHFEAAQRQRRARLLREYVRGIVADDDRGRLEAAIARDLIELGIRIENIH